MHPSAAPSRVISMRDLMSSPQHVAEEDRARRRHDSEDEMQQLSARAASAIHVRPTAKASIAFILDGSDDDSDNDTTHDDVVPKREIKQENHHPGAGKQPASYAWREHPPSPSRALTAEVDAVDESSATTDATTKRKKKRKARICKEPGCQKYVVDHGLCIRHGGGKRCNVEDCNCRAQNRGLCWKHGGYTICKIAGCTKRAKSRGICWSHGGGTRCKTTDCTKIAVSQGRCWAHGGGKRCVAEGCRKPASERTDNFCVDHFGGLPER